MVAWREGVGCGSGQSDTIRCGTRERRGLSGTGEDGGAGGRGETKRGKTGRDIYIRIGVESDCGRIRGGGGKVLVRRGGVGVSKAAS